MDQTTKPATEVPAKPKVSNKFVSDDFPCVCRIPYVPRSEIDRTVKVGPFRIVRRRKSPLDGILFHDQANTGLLKRASKFFLKLFDRQS